MAPAGNLRSACSVEGAFVTEATYRLLWPHPLIVVRLRTYSAYALAIR